ncbi:MAG: hypothetical protein ACI4UX_02490 [Clostridia bacterium]
MVIFWIILILILILLIFFIMLLLSTIQIETRNLKFDSTKSKKNKLLNYSFIVRLKVFNKITWLKLNISKSKINKAKKSNLYKKTINKIGNFKGIEKFKIEDIKLLKHLNIKIDKLKLYIKIDTKNITVTSLLTTIISTLIAIVLSKTTTRYEKEKYEYKIEPIFCMQNILKIYMDCIISLKMVHIINIIYILKKKRSVNKYDKRTSHRRAYAYSNE